MSKLELLRKKLDKKLFNTQVLGSEIGIATITRANGTFGGYDGFSETETSENIIAVPYNTSKTMVSYQPFGTLEQGESMIAVRYDQTINKEDKITILDKTYRVKEIKPIVLNTGIGVILCKCTEN